jgi:hypothetical protein
MSVRRDGKYIACFDAAREERAFEHGDDQTNPASIMDADTGEVVCRPELPMGRFRTAIHWLNDHEALVATETRLCRFDYMKGVVVKEISIDHTGLGSGLGELTEDGQSILIIEGGGRMPHLELESVDIRTGESTETGEGRLPRFTGNARGLIPGGKFFYIGDPGMYIFGRATLELIAQKEFRDLDLLQISFSPDGRRFAVVTGGRIFIDDELRKWDPETKSIVRVHDTATMRTLYAFPASTRWVSELVFSPDGTHLALANGDGSLEVWGLPDE